MISHFLKVRIRGIPRETWAGRVLSPNTWGMHSYVMEIMVKNSILLIIEAAIDFLDVPFFPSNGL